MKKIKKNGKKWKIKNQERDTSKVIEREEHNTKYISEW